MNGINVAIGATPNAKIRHRWPAVAATPIASTSNNLGKGTACAAAT